MRPSPPNQPRRSWLSWVAALAGLATIIDPRLAPSIVLTVTKPRELFPQFISSRLIVGALLCYVVLSLVHRRLDHNLVHVFLAWLTFTSVFQLRRNTSAGLQHYLAGFRLAWFGLGAWLIAYPFVTGEGRSLGFISWSHPNLTAHTWIALSATVFLASRTLFMRAVAALGMVTGVLLTGSRSALLALAFLLFGSLFFRRTRKHAIVALAVALLVTAALVAINPQAAWFQRSLGAFSTVFASPPRINMLNASERIGDSAYWARLGVDVRPLGQGSTNEPSEWVITRTEAVDWSRVQQTVELEPGVFTLSVEFLAGDGTTPGWLGWTDADGTVSEIRAWSSGGEVMAMGRGRIQVIDSGLLPAAEGSGESWQRMFVTFEVKGNRVLRLGLGPGPAIYGGVPSASISLRAPQLEVGSIASPYEATQGVGSATALAARYEALARIPLWEFAVRSWLERPLIGWGYGSFSGLSQKALDLPTGASHPHNIVLASAFDGGILGVAALVLVILAFYNGTGRILKMIVTALLLANLVDATILSPMVLAPLAVLAAIDARGYVSSGEGNGDRSN